MKYQGLSKGYPSGTYSGGQRKAPRGRAKIHRVGREEGSIWNIAKDELKFQGREASVLVHPFN